MDKQLAIRRVRIAVSVFFGVLTVLLCVLWVRSQDHIDRLTWHYRMPHAIQIGAAPGRIQIWVFTDTPQPAGPMWTPLWETMRFYGGVTQWKFEIMHTPSGNIIAIPQRFLISMLGFFASVPWLFGRFSLRTLLIATTLVAVVLGLGVWLAR